MTYYIIIRGPAGVGKSTISKLLAKETKAKVIQYDKIMKSFGLDYVFEDKGIMLKNYLKAHKVMVPKLKEKLEKGINLIIDHNFYHKEQIQDLTKNLDFSNFIFTLKADVEECIRRDRSRNDPLGEKAIKDVFRLVSAFDFGISIDTDQKTPQEVVEEIIHNIES
ncbi:MAG: Shikimate kinase [Candidatus Woesearchaeota archaeon]|nr:Shikimate kinase [Candidatus Woesearchaeota archaeon]